MADYSYLFVDGAYLRQRHSEVMSRVFDKAPALDLSSLRDALTLERAFQRVFYYDCLHDIAKVEETPEQLGARIKEQRDFFDQIQALHGFHLRLGSLSGSSRKLRQKEVDILLAVEMLDHAFRKNMSSAGLIAGDLDFVPLVDSLVRLGTWVDIFYDPKSISQGLLEAADRGTRLGLSHYYKLCTPEFRAANPLPEETGAGRWDPTAEGLSLARAGRLPTGEAVELYEGATRCALLVRRQPHPSLLSHENRAVLENYFSVVHSPIEWREETDPRSGRA